MESEKAKWNGSKQRNENNGNQRKKPAEETSGPELITQDRRAEPNKCNGKQVVDTNERMEGEESNGRRRIEWKAKNRMEGEESNGTQVMWKITKSLHSGHNLYVYFLKFFFSARVSQSESN